MPLTLTAWLTLPHSPAGILSEFSAVCWLFGRYMFEKLKYPIGLVESCWGGTSVEAWSSPRALKQCGLQQTENRSGMPQRCSLSCVLRVAMLLLHDPSTKEKSSVLWNAMIHPFRTMTIYGAIWYQGKCNLELSRVLFRKLGYRLSLFILAGEANADYNKNKYNCSFPAMIDDWRMAFHSGSGGQTADDFPFGFVQVRSYFLKICLFRSGLPLYLFYT